MGTSLYANARRRVPFRVAGMQERRRDPNGRATAVGMRIKAIFTTDLL
jgi:hypothetical protein